MTPRRFDGSGTQVGLMGYAHSTSAAKAGVFAKCMFCLSASWGGRREHENNTEQLLRNSILASPMPLSPDAVIAQLAARRSHIPYHRALLLCIFICFFFAGGSIGASLLAVTDPFRFMLHSVVTIMRERVAATRLHFQQHRTLSYHTCSSFPFFSLIASLAESPSFPQWRHGRRRAAHLLPPSADLSQK